MSTMIFKHNDGYNNFILSHPTAKLLYSLQIPTTVYSKLTKKTNKRKTKADDLYIDVKEQVIDRLTNNYGYMILTDLFAELVLNLITNKILISSNHIQLN